MMRATRKVWIAIGVGALIGGVVGALGAVWGQAGIGIATGIAIGAGIGLLFPGSTPPGKTGNDKKRER